MDTIDIADGGVIIGTPSSRMIGVVNPIADGFWVSIGHPTHQGILVDAEEWNTFIQLVNSIDNYVRSEYNEQICD
jgi:hypothetical protein